MYECMCFFLNWNGWWRCIQDHKKRINKIIKDYTAKLAERTGYHMGYPYNLDFDFGALEGLKNFSINNLGDPFIESNYGVHSREFEVTPDSMKMVVVTAKL